MATLAAQITSTGISAPDFQDVLQQLKIIYWSIYGSDAVLDDDSQDGQFLAAFAQAITDVNQEMIALYNAFSPSTAQGTGLSSLVKINGLRRLVPTNSQAIVTITGDVGATINGGVVGDDVNLSTQWNLPAVVVIPLSGTIDVTATCTVPGEVTAAVGTLTRILTPTLGWQTVTNASAASPGQPVETDSQLRTRQTGSVALPSLTVLEGIFAAVDEIDGVTRLKVYENSTDVTDGDGILRHTIAAVVLGGDVTTIAEAIALKKAPGIGTQGTTSVVVTDSHGVPNTINFYALDVVPLEMQISIHPLTGYTSTTADAIKSALVDFVNALEIGEDSYTTRLYSPANLGGVGIGATFVVTAITQSRDGDPLAATDIVMAFNEAASLVLGDVAVVLV